jgi:hypothetical protein
MKALVVRRERRIKWLPYLAGIAGFILVTAAVIWLRGGSMELLDRDQWGFGITPRYKHGRRVGGGDEATFVDYEVDIGLVAIFVK